MWDGENAMTMDTGNEFGSHVKSDVLEIAAVRAGIHGTAIGKINAVNYLVNIKKINILKM